MVALIILGVLVGIIVLICLIPVGVDLGYEQEKLHVSAKVMGLLLQLYPKPPPDPNKPPKEKKPKKEKKKKKPEEEPQEEKPKKKRKLSFNKDELLELLKAALRGVGKLGGSVNVDRFVLRFVAAGDDPYNTAMLYGYVNAALSSLAPLCRKRFAVKDCDVQTAVDFAADRMYLDFGLAMTIRIGQVLGAVLGIGVKAAVILVKNKIRLKREAKLNPQEKAQAEAKATAEGALDAATKEALTDKQENTTDQTIPLDERKDSNGNSGE